MKFHDTGNTHNSLTHYVNFLLGFPEGDTNEFPLAAKARSVNTAKYELASELYRNSDEWDFDDAGNTDLPIATATLVNSQRDYTLPTTALAINRIEIKDSSGQYYPIQIIDELDIRHRALEDYGEDDSRPLRAWVKGRSLFLDPAPNTAQVTAAEGLKLYFERGANEFTGATTTTDVGFNQLGDRLLAHMVALEFAAPKGMERTKNLFSRVQELRAKVLAEIANRSKTKRKKIQVKQIQAE